MEKMMDALVDELTTRVIAKLEANASGAYNFLKLKVKAENIEGLTVDNIEGLRDLINDVADAAGTEAGKRAGEEAGADAAESLIKNASFSVDVSV